MENTNISSLDEMKQRGRILVKKDFRKNWEGLIDTNIFPSIIIEASLQCMEALSNATESIYTISKNIESFIYNGAILTEEQKNIVVGLIATYHERGNLLKDTYQQFNSVQQTISKSK